jgi:hypothetical protein
VGTESRNFIVMGIAATTVSCLFFLSLLCGFNIYVACILAATLVAVFARFVFSAKDSCTTPTPPKTWHFVVWVLCQIWMVKVGVHDGLKHGDWDAWALWNCHANFLCSDKGWRNLFLPAASDHPDYPLGIPATVAFFVRLFGKSSMVIVPFCISLFYTMLVPSLLYFELIKKNVVPAIICLFLVTHDVMFIRLGVAQYADTAVAFFLLAAVVCIEYAKISSRFAAVTAFLMVSCAWTKNEGIVLALLFAVFFADVLFSRKNILMTLAGAALPLATLLAFKSSCPPNDIVAGQTRATLHYLVEYKRYQTIFEALMNVLNYKFYYLKAGLLVYAVVCFLQRMLPSRSMAFLLCCMGAYFLVYLVTPHNLNWHLETSQDRLMAHLAPAFLLVLGNKFSEIKFSLQNIRSSGK